MTRLLGRRQTKGSADNVTPTTSLSVCAAKKRSKADIPTMEIENLTSSSVITENALRELLPNNVVVAELWNINREFPMHSEELRCIAFAVPKRVREFSAGRYCARLALNELGIRQFPLLMSEDRSPCWPSTVVGSITHAGGYCGVAIGERKNFLGIGIDVAVVSQVDEILGHDYSDRWSQIFTDEETKWLNSLPPQERVNMVTVIFSAKEAFYKCQYCVTRRFLDFNAATIRPDDGFFAVELHESSPPLRNGMRYHGRFVLRSGLALTTVVITAG